MTGKIIKIGTKYYKEEDVQKVFDSRIQEVPVEEIETIEPAPEPLVEEPTQEVVTDEKTQ